MAQEPVCRQQVTVGLENGLHLVPCSQIAQVVRKSDCRVQIHKGEQSVDAADVLDLMTLSAEFGATLVLEASGDRASEVIGRLVDLFESNFEVEESAES